MNAADIAYLRMVTDHQAAIHCFIRSIAPGLSDAEDVLQETNIVLWKKMETFSAGTNFKSFAFRIAYLKTLEALRRRGRDRTIPFGESTMKSIAESWESTPEKDLLKADALTLCLEQLPAHDRTLVERRYMHGMTVRAMAGETMTGEGALQQKFFRIRQALRNCIQRRMESPEARA